MKFRPFAHASLVALILMVSLPVSLALVAWSAGGWRGPVTSQATVAGAFAIAVGGMVAIFGLVRILFGDETGAAAKELLP